MQIRKRHLSASLIGLSLISPAQAEPDNLSFAFNSDQHKSSFEQVQSVIDDRINVAMNIGLPKRGELNLSIGALSLAFPENSNKAIDVDVRPFFYVGIGSYW